MRTLLTTAALLGACASPPPADAGLEPLPVAERFAVEYAGSIDTDLGVPLLPEAAVGSAAASAGQPQARVDARIVRLPASAARRLFGLAGAGGGRVASGALNEAFDRLVESQVAEEVSAPSLVVALGQPATTALAHQIALVRGFDITSADARFIGDPRIEPVEVGMSLEIGVDEAEGGEGLAVSVAVRVIDMLGAPRRISGSFDGTAELSLQVPLACHQRMAAASTVAGGEALYLTGLLVPGTEDILAVSLEARLTD
jgi:hypothetical protein